LLAAWAVVWLLLLDGWFGGGGFAGGPSPVTGASASLREGFATLDT
jgi:hypothetical protein